MVSWNTLVPFVRPFKKWINDHQWCQIPVIYEHHGGNVLETLSETGHIHSEYLSYPWGMIHIEKELKLTEPDVHKM